MGNETKRMTLVIPEDLEQSLDKMKKEYFYNCSRSEMIRTLITEGLNSIKHSAKESA